MVSWLVDAGCDVLHTLDLLDGNRTTDEQINNIAERDRRIVITKDGDFVDSHLLTGRPDKLLLISTGNIRNSELQSLMVPLIPELLREFQVNSFLELGLSGVAVRG